MLDRFGTLRVAEPFLDARDPLLSDPLIGSCQVIRPRRGKHGLQALGEMFALCEPQTHSRIQLAELRVDPGQPRLVVLPTEFDDVTESFEAGLPTRQLRSQILQVEIIL